MSIPFGQTLIDVWHNVLAWNVNMVLLGTERYPVRLTPMRHPREVDFVIEGNMIRGI
jgi:hypothetical protein